MQIFDRVWRDIRRMDPADMRAVRPVVLWLPGIVSGVIAVLVAVFSLTGYQTHKSALEIFSAQTAQTILEAMERGDDVQAAHIADTAMQRQRGASVSVVDQSGKTVFAPPEDGTTERPLLTVPFKRIYSGDCAEGVSACVVSFVYDLQSPLLIWMRVVLIAAVSFLAVLMVTTRLMRRYAADTVRRPVSRLAHAMQEVLQTGQPVECGKSVHSELNLLAEVFNEIQDKLHKTQTDLERARHLETVGIITSGVAHEFNNLLAVILGNIDMLSDKARQNPQDARRLRELEVAASNSAMIVEKLLAYSQTNRNRDKGKRINTRILLENVQGLIGPFSRNINVTFHNSCEDQFLSGSGDLECALLTLTKNACEALGETGNIRINVRPATQQDCRDGQSAGDFLVIEVMDDGPGVPPHQKDRIFEPFFSTKTAGKGIGLGLWTVFRFVEQRGGSISYLYQNQQQPYGSIFRLLLPGCPFEPRPVTVPKDHSEQKLNGKRLLVVEDEVSLMNIYSDYFSKLGLNVVKAATVSDALSKLEEYGDSIDLVLSDFQLLDGLGTKVLEARKKINPNACTILLSGNVDETKADLSCADVTMLKPIRLSELEKGIRDAFSGGIPQLPCNTCSKPCTQAGRVQPGARCPSKVLVF